MVTNHTIEHCLHELGLKYTRQGDGHWELKFRGSAGGFTLHILNGLANPVFVSLLLVLVWAPAKHRAAVYRRLLQINAEAGLAKVEVDNDGDVLLTSYLLRNQFSCAKLKDAMDGVLQAADRNLIDLKILERHGR